jgi:hypothetical protein
MDICWRLVWPFSVSKCSGTDKIYLIYSVQSKVDKHFILIINHTLHSLIASKYSDSCGVKYYRKGNKATIVATPATVQVSLISTIKDISCYMLSSVLSERHSCYSWPAWNHRNAWLHIISTKIALVNFLTRISHHQNDIWYW